MAGITHPEPIAIVGMGCRWPGNIRDAPGLWELLKNRRSGYRELEAPRFSTKGFYHPNSDRPASMSTQGAFLVDEDPRLFDPSFFGITGIEAENMDPSQRKLLEVVYDAFENGGETLESISGSRTGVFCGNFSFDHFIAQARDWDRPRPYALTGAASSILSNRINYIFNLHGPSLAVDTACSSSMYALHMAVNAIRNGDCDSAIVAGSNWIMDPMLHMALDKLGALSATSACHTFDADADGYGRGEGFVAIYLKRATSAVSDASPIRALIRGTAINANGRTGGITRPSAVGQEAVIRKAYANAGNLSLEDTAYFELHGTGTPVGDPIESTAVSNVFASTRSEDPNDHLLVGSVKTNLGHTEGASALAAIMKVVLSLENGMIPPSYGVRKLNPQINFEEKRLKVVAENPVPWPENRLRRASINSFGFGGANVRYPLIPSFGAFIGQLADLNKGHCIIDHVHNVFPGYVKPGCYQHDTNGSGTNGHATNGNGTNGHATNGHGSTTDDTVKDTKSHPKSAQHGSATTLRKIAKAQSSTPDYVLLPFSAHSEYSLRKNIEAISDALPRHSLADVAFTLSTKRSRFSYRTSHILSKDASSFQLSKEARVLRPVSQSPRIGFVFTGQGAQWHAMGANLFVHHVFRNSIEYVDKVLAGLSTPPAWKIKEILLGNCAEDFIQRPEISQTVCTATQIGLVDLLSSWSVQPDAVMGHSSGEIAVAYAAGRITAAESIVIAYCRGQAVSKNKQDGLMLAVGLGPEEASQCLQDFTGRTVIAAINSPLSITVSGDADAIKQLSDKLSSDGVFNRLLKTGGNAYHSHHMAALGSGYNEVLSEALRSLPPTETSHSRRYPLIAWASSVDPAGDLFDLMPTASYWQRNLESPVRFSDAVKRIFNSPTSSVDILVEVGPHGALQGPLNQTLKTLGKEVAYAPSLKRGQDGQISLLTLAGTLFGLGASIDLVSVNGVPTTVGDSTQLVHGCTAVDLPPYQHTYGPIQYLESRPSREYRLRDVLSHDLIGSQIPGRAKLQPQWRNVLRLKDLPWLGDHRLLPYPVFPAAGYIAMAIAAAAQVYNAHPKAGQVHGYRMRNVNIRSALRIPEDDYGVEVLLTLDIPDAAAQPSAWCKFALSSVSRDSDEWSEHCTGLVKIEEAPQDDLEKIPLQSITRKVDSQAWYRRFTEVGLGYGETFQGLSDVVAYPSQGLASAKVGLKTTSGTVKGGESAYPLHPAALDSVIQLSFIAATEGNVDTATSAFVPIRLDRLYLANTLTDEFSMATARADFRGQRGLYADLQLLDGSGTVALDVQNLRLITYTGDHPQESSAQRQVFGGPFMRTAWKPDVRYMNNKQACKLFPPPKQNLDRIPDLERMATVAALIIVDIYESYSNQKAVDANVAHFVAWVANQVESSENDEIAKAKALSSAERQQRLQQLYQEVGHLVEVEMSKRIHENFDDILHNRRTGIDVVLKDGVLNSLYETGLTMTGAYPQFANALDGLAHANPHLQVLELGAGTGGATRVAMKTLCGPNSIKRYSRYTFTDVTPGFLSTAKNAMSEFQDVDYAVLDIEEDPSTQNFGPTYDVVIASQILHATKSIATTLDNCRKLLKPGGKLLLIENTTNEALIFGIMLGTLTGYWHGIPDGRTQGPFLTLPQWESALVNAGFAGVGVTLGDNLPPHNNTTTILSTLRAVQPSNGVDGDDAVSKKLTRVSLLHSRQQDGLLEHISNELDQRAIPYQALPILEAEDNSAVDSHVIVLLDAQRFLFDADQRSISVLQQLARNAASMVWVTTTGMLKASQAVPSGAFFHGLLRTIGTENPELRLRSVDVDLVESDVVIDPELGQFIVDQSVDVQLSASEAHEEDMDFVWQDNCIWVSRLVPDAKLQSYAESNKNPTTCGGFEMAPLDSRGPVRAAFETPGLLTSLYFKPYNQMFIPLDPDWIEVKVAAVGLNWKDLGLSSGRFDANNLSNEYTGTVTRIGTNVSGLSVGDQVYGVGQGHFGNVTRVPAAFAHKVQPRGSDDLVAIATMPLVYMTAIYAFDHLARLESGDKVLIQSATGGLGLAAIQLARSKNADIYVTVGGAEKAQYVNETVGIPFTHILASREVADIGKAFGFAPGEGFDVILSTSRGDMLRASLNALAPLGHLVDVGRMDVLDAQSIHMDFFQKSTNFSSFDLMDVLASSPAMGRKLIQAVDKYYQAGLIGPISPRSATDVSQLDQVLLGFSKGKHVGKLVVTFQDPQSLIKMLPAAPQAQFSEEACYIITGGMSGLGLSIILWMVERGARKFVILSRRGPQDSQDVMKLLESKKIIVRAISCDVSDKDQVVAAVSQACELGPVQGVVHAAVSYQDISFDKLTAEHWKNGVAAKVKGSINLHEATKSLPLDFFVMTTSTNTVFAPATQSVYNASNQFQEYFARYRKQLGLPASSASFGLITDVGPTSEKSTAFNIYARNKVLMLTEHQFLNRLEPAFLKPEELYNNPSVGSAWFGQSHDPLSAVSYMTCMDPAAMARQKIEEAKAGGGGIVEPRWYNDGRVSLVMRAFKDAQAAAENSHSNKNAAGGDGKSATALIRAEFDQLIKAGAEGREKSDEFAAQSLVSAISAMLFAEASSVNLDKSVADHGVDSLIAAELRNWLQVALGYKTSMLDLLDARSSVRALAGSVVSYALEQGGSEPVKG